MASRFKTFSEDGILVINEANRAKKYQKRDEPWLVGVYCKQRLILYIVKKVPAK